MFLSKILIHSCMTIHYFVEKNIFVVIVCKLLEHQKNWNVVLKIALKLMVNKLLRCLRRANILKLKHFGRKIKSSFMIYADFESILVPEDNGKENWNESYTNKYQKHAACSYGYKVVCVDDKFS